MHMCSVLVSTHGYFTCVSWLLDSASDVERASLNLGLGGHRALKERVILHAGRACNWLHNLRTSYVICVACLFRFIALITSYVTCLALLVSTWGLKDELCADQLETSTSAPPPRANPGHLNFWRLDRSNSRPLWPKWCSNALPYRRICLSNAPPKEQSSSAPVIFNKACVHVSWPFIWWCRFYQTWVTTKTQL